MKLAKQPLNEASLRFEALQKLREVQADLTRLNFLDVISMMREDNPKRSDVLSFEDDLNALTSKIGDFIQKAKSDVEYEPSEDEVDDDAEDTEDTEDTEDAEDTDDAEDEVDEHIVIDSSVSDLDKVI